MIVKLLRREQNFAFCSTESKRRARDDVMLPLEFLKKRFSASHFSMTARFFSNTSILLSRRVLLCGDGNLSFAASIANKLRDEGSHLMATVLESKEEHNRGMHTHGISDGESRSPTVSNVFIYFF